MFHTTFTTEVRVIEDDSDPQHLKTEFALIRSVSAVLCWHACSEKLLFTAHSATAVTASAVQIAAALTLTAVQRQNAYAAVQKVNVCFCCIELHAHLCRIF